MAIKICCISDTHGMHRQITTPPCDLLIHAGDFSSRGMPHEVINFLDWFSRQPAEHHVYIAGNHDLTYENAPDFKREMLASYPELHYLENSGVELLGQYIWGSPYTPEFNNWAFNLPRGGTQLYMTWECIPRKTDILVCHGAAKDILDRCNYSNAKYPQNAGCELLRHRIEELGRLPLFIHGHIHESRGADYRTLLPTTIINASTCTAQYKPTNPPILLEMDPQTKMVTFV